MASKKVENSRKKIALKTLAGTALALVSLKLLSLGYTAYRNNVQASSVMVTNTEGNHGGSGVILSSSQNSSQILTNSHVCKVVENGGMIKTKTREYAVTSYKHSKAHDICLITVDADLGVNTAVAQETPNAYYENARISGHPSLFPNVVTSGHYSGKKVIAIMTGLRTCTEEDMRDERKISLCLFFGGIPEIKRFESTLVTATISPGSSGSGVYNDRGELTGLAFAGSGGIGYAWTVPYESLRNFIEKEQQTLEAIRPTNSVDFFGQNGQGSGKFNESEAISKAYAACENPNDKVKEFCAALSSDMVFRK